MGAYFGLFEDQDSVFNAFDVPEEAREGVQVVAATYEDENYEGDATVIFRRDGQLFEVHGGHCSCYGLEGQWEPEPVVLSELLARMERIGTPFAEFVINTLSTAG